MGNYNQIKVYEVCARGFVIIADSIVMGKNTPYRKEKAKRKCKKNVRDHILKRMRSRTYIIKHVI